MGPEFVSKTTKFLIHFGGGLGPLFFIFPCFFWAQIGPRPGGRNHFGGSRPPFFFFGARRNFFEANFGSKKGFPAPGAKSTIGHIFLIVLGYSLLILLGPSWGPLGALLGLSWGPFGPFLGPFWASQMDKDTQLLPRTAIFKMHCLALQISHKSTRK